MTGDGLRAYLAEDERLRGRWSGSVDGADGWRSAPATIAATDRRLVWLTGDGEFGAVALDGVDAVESWRETRTRYEGMDYRLVVGAGLALAVGCFAAAVVSTSGLVSLAMVLGSAGGVALAEHGWRSREAYDGVRRVETALRRFAVVVEDGRTRRLTVPADGRVDAEFSRLVAAGDGRRDSGRGGGGRRSGGREGGGRRDDRGWRGDGWPDGGHRGDGWPDGGRPGRDGRGDGLRDGGRWNEGGLRGDCRPGYSRS